jgi:ApbE superfamily uncharacterized protein (UPF0280 family)
MGFYEPRLYRLDARPEKLVAFKVEIKESDLLIFAEKNLEKEALNELLRVRGEIESWISIYPEFYASLTPLSLPAATSVPEVVKEMYDASRKAGVGPMAAVAGAVAEAVGRRLLEFSREVIVENGGDIFCYSLKERYSLVYAGKSPFSKKIAVRIPQGKPVGICTSSGTVGHSLSFGKADAVVVLDENAALADAAATAIGNVVRNADEIERGIKRAAEIGVGGVLIIVGDKLGAWGEVELEAI